ncbi:MAG: hypothetical protein HY239_04280 [Mycolicibacterium aromaticivorans]|nr:hypothetical protein [Mycolicibacterium aromaticivorans]
MLRAEPAVDFLAPEEVPDLVEPPVSEPALLPALADLLVLTAFGVGASCDVVVSVTACAVTVVSSAASAVWVTACGRPEWARPDLAVGVSVFCSTAAPALAAAAGVLSAANGSGGNGGRGNGNHCRLQKYATSWVPTTPRLLTVVWAMAVSPLRQTVGFQKSLTTGSRKS